MSKPTAEDWVQQIANVLPSMGPDDRPAEELAPYMQVAGMCWTTTWTGDIEMDTHLGEAFARALRLALEQQETRLTAALKLAEGEKERLTGTLMLVHADLAIDTRRTNLGAVGCNFCLRAHGHIHAAIDTARDGEGG